MLNLNPKNPKKEERSADQIKNIFSQLDRRLDRLAKGLCKTSIKAIDDPPGHVFFKKVCSCGGHTDCVTKDVF